VSSRKGDLVIGTNGGCGMRSKELSAGNYSFGHSSGAAITGFAGGCQLMCQLQPTTSYTHLYSWSVSSLCAAGQGTHAAGCDSGFVPGEKMLSGCCLRSQQGICGSEGWAGSQLVVAPDIRELLTAGHVDNAATTVF
jgi:hypothetical protein